MNTVNRHFGIVLLFLFALTTEARGLRDGFAVVIDPVSLREAKAEIVQYEKAITEMQGLHVYEVVDRWGVPDSIRAELIRLYQSDTHPLCGSVFVGDIPVPMIRDAQFLTSAFRMSQTYPWEDSSAPSDRYYDDFGLQFDFLRKDSTGTCFYYSLSSRGNQYVRPSIFSGRIRPTDASGLSRYEKLRRYLRKATDAKRNPEPFASLFIYTGSGSLNESKMAHMSEMVSLYEHFPMLCNLPNSIRYTDYTDVPDIKSRLMSQMMNPDLSMAIMHHHGDYDTQYLAKNDSMNLRLPDFVRYGYTPNCRVCIYDACYNGVFHRENSIANEYIFQPGKTILGIGGSVNVLQDKWPDKLIGLMAEGLMAGYVNQYTADLEMHVVGDPTFCFAAPQSDRLNTLIANTSEKRWLKMLNEKTQSVDMHVLCMEQLAYSQLLSDDRLLHIVESSLSGLERLEAYTLLMRRNSLLFPQAMVQASTDTYELLQRLSVVHMSKYGGDEVIDALAERIAAVETTPRVAFDAMEGIQFFPDQKIKVALERSVAKRRGAVVKYEDYAEAVMAKYKKYAGRWDSDINQLCQGELTGRKAQRQTEFMRLYCPPYLLAKVASYAETCNNDSLKMALLDVMGWQRLSYTSPQAYEVAHRMSLDESLPQSVRSEALRTMKRIRPLQDSSIASATLRSEEKRK